MPSDRGSIKWTSMMLPEHVELLKQLWEEDTIEIKPILDPQLIDEIEYTLAYAYREQETVSLSFYHNRKEITKIGIIKECSREKRSLLLQLVNGQTITIPFATVTSISLLME